MLHVGRLPQLDDDAGAVGDVEQQALGLADDFVRVELLVFEPHVGHELLDGGLDRQVDQRAGDGRAALGGEGELPELAGAAGVELVVRVQQARFGGQRDLAGAVGDRDGAGQVAQRHLGRLGAQPAHDGVEQAGLRAAGGLGPQGGIPALPQPRLFQRALGPDVVVLERQVGLVHHFAHGLVRRIGLPDGGLVVIHGMSAFIARVRVRLRMRVLRVALRHLLLDHGHMRAGAAERQAERRVAFRDEGFRVRQRVLARVAPLPDAAVDQVEGGFTRVAQRFTRPGGHELVCLREHGRGARDKFQVGLLELLQLFIDMQELFAAGVRDGIAELGRDAGVVAIEMLLRFRERKRRCAHVDLPQRAAHLVIQIQLGRRRSVAAGVVEQLVLLEDRPVVLLVARVELRVGRVAEFHEVLGHVAAQVEPEDAAGLQVGAAVRLVADAGVHAGRCLAVVQCAVGIADRVGHVMPGRQRQRLLAARVEALGQYLDRRGVGLGHQVAEAAGAAHLFEFFVDRRGQQRHLERVETLGDLGVVQVQRLALRLRVVATDRRGEGVDQRLQCLPDLARVGAGRSHPRAVGVTVGNQLDHFAQVVVFEPGVAGQQVQPAGQPGGPLAEFAAQGGAEVRLAGGPVVDIAVVVGEIDPALAAAGADGDVGARVADLRQQGVGQAARRARHDVGAALALADAGRLALQVGGFLVRVVAHDVVRAGAQVRALELIEQGGDPLVHVGQIAAADVAGELARGLCRLGEGIADGEAGFVRRFARAVGRNRRDGVELVFQRLAQFPGLGALLGHRRQRVGQIVHQLAQVRLVQSAGVGIDHGPGGRRVRGFGVRLGMDRAASHAA